MKISFTILLLQVLLALVSCQKTLKISPRGEDSLPVLMGELNQLYPAVLSLTTASNNTKPSSTIQPITNADVSITNNTVGNTTSFQYNTKKKRWESSMVTLPENNYTLSVKIENKMLQTTIQMPAPFTAFLSQTSASNIFKLTIENKNPKMSYYIIECVRTNSNGEKHLTEMRSPDAFTDNYIYGEFPEPYIRLFFRSICKKKVVKVVFAPFDSDQYKIIIKSVNKDYYNYMYNYEIQKSRNIFNTPLHTSEKNYFGKVGACYVMGLDPKNPLLGQ